MKRHIVLYIDIQPVDIKNIIGIHGYVYTDDEVGNKSGKRPNKTQITTHGYLNNQDLKKIKHDVITPEFFIDGYHQYITGIDNVIYETLKRIIKLKSRHNIDTIMVITNNSKLMKIINNDIDKIKLDLALSSTEIEYLKKISEVYRGFKTRRVYDYVTQHGLRRANEGISVAINTNKTSIIKLSNIKYYWAPETIRHNMFIGRYIVFKNGMKDIPKYCFATYKKDDPIGLRTNYVVYYTTLLEDLVKEVSFMKKLFLDYLGDLEVICSINVDNLYNNNVRALFQVYGKDIFVVTNVRNVIIKTVVKKLYYRSGESSDIVLGEEIKPVGIAGFAITNCSKTETILKDYLDYKKTNKTMLHYEEITDVFYDEANKSLFRKEIVNEHKFRFSITQDSVLRDGNPRKISLRFLTGLDVLPRNTLKKLEKLKPRVYIVFYVDSGVILENYCIIDYDDRNELTVWSNFYSNKIPLKIDTK